MRLLKRIESLAVSSYMRALGRSRCLSGMNWVAVYALLILRISASTLYNESLSLTPLPRNKFLSSFQFHSESPEYPPDSPLTHFGLFPRALTPIIHQTNARELHLRFSSGWWDNQWGSLPYQGAKSGGTGVELSAIFEAASPEDAFLQWQKLAKTLAGYFCASLNSIDSAKTSYPKRDHKLGYTINPKNNLYSLRAALPAEPVCTENLTPFIKLLPTRGKAGVASLLDGHKLYDSLWHSMAIDFTTECTDVACKLNLSQTISNVVDVQRSLYTQHHGPIPKPLSGDELECDEETHKADIWQCFPKDDFSKVEYSLDTLFGRHISGPAFHNDDNSSRVIINAPPQWTVKVDRSEGLNLYSRKLNTDGPISYPLSEEGTYNVRFSTDDSLAVVPPVMPPVSAARSLTGYSQDRGGFRIVLSNPSSTDTVEFVYFESLPWFLRLYLHTRKIELKNETGTFNHDNSAISFWLKQQFDLLQYITSQYYKPAVDRARPSHLEYSVRLPPNLLLTLTYQFDKSLLHYHEYPPDANHGFALDPAVVTVWDGNKEVYQMRTASLLVTLPTPDFSMPYNVIILTCTVMSLSFGLLFNLLSKQVVLELEMEKMTANSKVGVVKTRIIGAIAQIKGVVARKRART